MRTDREDQDSNIYPLTQGGKDSGKRKENLNATLSLITTSVDQHVFIVKEMKMTDCVKILCQKHLYEKKNRCQVRTKLFAVCKNTSAIITSIISHVLLAVGWFVFGVFFCQIMVRLE